MRARYLVASTVAGIPAADMLPEDKDHERKMGTGVALAVKSGGRFSDPGQVLATGFEPTQASKIEYFELQLSAKTRFHDGRQYISPDDLATVAISTAQADVSKHLLLTLDRKTGVVTPREMPDPNARAQFENETRSLFGVTERVIEPKLPDQEKARQALLNEQERQRLFIATTEFAMCGRYHGQLPQEGDHKRLTALATDVLAALNGFTPDLTQFQKITPSAFGGGVDPAAQATRSAFADVATNPQLLLGYNPHNHAAAAKIAAQTPSGDQIIGAPWHRRDEWAGAAKGSFHPSFGYASRREVDEMIKAPAGPRLAALRGEIFRRIEDEHRTLDELAGKRWDPVI